MSCETQLLQIADQAEGKKSSDIHHTTVLGGSMEPKASLGPEKWKRKEKGRRKLKKKINKKLPRGNGLKKKNPTLVKMYLFLTADNVFLHCYHSWHLHTE